jgi:hypothetical protein
MRALVWITCGLMLFAVAGCDNSDNDGKEEPGYPDIPGLVVFYDFNGNLDNAVADIHHGVKASAVEYVADRWANSTSAVLADGEPIVVADHADLDITGGITLAAWVRPEPADQAYSAVVDKDYLTAYSLGMYGGIASPDTVHLTAYIADQSFGSSEVVPLGTGVWSHVVFTYDEESGEGKFYVNGVLAGSSTRDVAIGTNDVDVYIGKAYHGDTYLGGIDQVAIFNRALTAEEVNDLLAFE